MHALTECADHLVEEFQEFCAFRLVKRGKHSFLSSYHCRPDSAQDLRDLRADMDKLHTLIVFI